MEQGVPGAQNEPFFELLHPNAMRAPAPTSSPPPPAFTDADDATSSPPPPPPPPPPPEPSPLQSIPPSYDFQLTRHPSKSMDVFKPGENNKVQDAPPSLYQPPLPSASSSENHHVPQGPVMYPATERDYRKPVEASEGTDRVTMAAIDNTMKSYADNVLHVLETINGRLSQLETTVEGLEHSVTGLKSGEWERQEQTTGRLKQLERLMEEVRTGLQLLHDKQIVAENSSPPRKSPSSEPPPPADGWQPPKVSSTEELPHVPYTERPPHFPPQYPLQGPPVMHPHYPQGPSPPQGQPFSAAPHVPLPIMNGPGIASSQPPYSPAAQAPPPPPPPPLQAPPPPPVPSQHSMPMTSYHSQPAAPAPPPQTHYTAETYSHIPAHPHHHPAPPTSAPMYLPEVPQYPPGVAHAGPRQQPVPQEVLHTSQQHVPSGPTHLYETAAGRVGLPPSNMGPSYLPKPAPSVSMYETPSGGGYGAPPYRAGQPIPSAPSGGAGSYPRLPTAHPVQHAGISSGPPPTARSSLDEVIDKVVSMGFPREQVRAVVRQVTENGQSAELNVVLDRLMNGGESPQPPRGWFGRG